MNIFKQTFLRKSTVHHVSSLYFDLYLASLVLHIYYWYKISQCTKDKIDFQKSHLISNFFFFFFNRSLLGRRKGERVDTVNTSNYARNMSSNNKKKYQYINVGAIIMTFDQKKKKLTFSDSSFKCYKTKNVCRVSKYLRSFFSPVFSV